MTINIAIHEYSSYKTMYVFLEEKYILASFNTYLI